jgi:hypothetical protein
LPVEEAVSVTVEETMALVEGETQEREGGEVVAFVVNVASVEVPVPAAFVAKAWKW